MYKNFKKVFCTILIFVLAFSSSFSSMAFAANDEVSTPYGLNKPTVYWDFDDGQYNFAGEADYSDLYSEYLFTDASKVEIYASKLNSLGIKFEEFGLNTIMITEHPTWLRTGYEEESLRRIIELVIEKHKFNPKIFNDNLAKTLACKMSVKGNTRITHEQMESILEKLVLCDNPYNCPHGRPTIINFTIYEIEKMFKRVMN